MNGRTRSGTGRQAQARPAVLMVAGAVVLAYALLLVLANIGCLSAFGRVEDQLELIVLVSAAIVLFAIGRFSPSNQQAGVVFAQVPAGFVTGLLVLPSVSLLFGVVEGALALRSLPVARRWTALGMITFLASTFLGYVFLRFLSSLSVPALIRCG